METTEPACLLVQLRDLNNTAAWREFERLFGPLMYRFASKHGLQHADAADFVQDVMLKLVRAMGRFKYDPQRGSFRSWLYAVARNELRDRHNAGKRHPAGNGDGGSARALEQLPAPPDDAEAVWEREYQRRRLAWAVARVRPQFRERTWQAFWRTAVECQPTHQVATTLAMNVGAVYMAKYRVIAQLREAVRQTGD